MASITLVLNEPEQNALRQLLDISLRQAGLYALDVVSHFNARLNEAAQAAVAPAPVSRPVVPAQVQAAATTAQPAQAHASAASAQHTGIIGHVIEAITGHSSTEPHAVAKAAAPATQATPASPTPHTAPAASAAPAAPAVVNATPPTPAATAASAAPVAPAASAQAAAAPAPSQPATQASASPAPSAPASAQAKS